MSTPAAARALAETVARALPGAHVVDDTVHLGFGGLSVTCAVNAGRPAGPLVSAACGYTLAGEALGPEPIFASMSGYAETEAAAVATGGREWATAFGGLLGHAFGAGGLPEGAEALALSIDGQARRALVNSVSRGFGGAATHPKRVAASLRRFGAGGWLVQRVFASGRLPLLHPTRPTLLSVFVVDGPRRVVEVKVNGTDWPAAAAAFGTVPPSPDRDVVMHRELAVLLPAGPAAPPSRARLEATLRGLAVPVGEAVREAVAWRGWAAHGGQLAAPLAPEAVAALGPLPPDYARFLAEVAGAGAGPGHGLLPPALSAAYAAGEFVPEGPLRGVVVLADGGCDGAFVLVREGPQAGEVWFDRPGTGERGRVAGSFTAWYADWLAAAVGNHFGAVPWAASRCVTPSLLTKWASGGRPPLAAGAIGLTSGGGALHAKGDPMPPCPACLVSAGREGLPMAAFADAPPPAALQPPVTRSWWRRWA